MRHNQQLFTSGNESIVGRVWDQVTHNTQFDSPGSISMQIDVANDNGTTIIRPGGDRLDIEVAAQFRATLLSLIEQGNRRLVIDLQNINFIDSSGLGALVSALKALKRTDGAGDVRLTRVQPPV